ncbi:MAG TPA: iron ABC transporter permease [Caldilineae bacterium]|nr:iron ABC transporter permease [Caldilineae bacterium]HIQ12570.1 iron ABC transporter permease [Caldilineales bacterium]
MHLTRTQRALLAAIPLLFLGLFFFYPILVIFRISLFPAGRFDAASLRVLWEKPYYLRVVWFTIWQAAASTLGALALGLPAAYLFAKFRFPGRNLLRALVTLPFVMPTVVVATAFIALIGPRGLVNQWLMTLFDLPKPPIRLLHTLWIILLAHVFYNTSVIIRMVGGVWANMDPRLEAAAAVLGAGPWRRARHITLPLLFPAILAAGLLAYLFNFTSFGVILILGGPRFATIEVAIYRTAVRLFNLPVAAALSILQMGFTLAMMAVYTRLQRRMTAPIEFQSAQRTQRPLRTAGEKLLAWMIFTTLAVFLLSPLLALVAQSFRMGDGVGLASYRALFENRTGSIFFVTPIEAARNSLAFALVTMLLSVIIALPAAYLLSEPNREGFSLARLLDPLFMLPLGTSAVTLGFGYIVALNRPPLNLRTSLLIVPIAHTLIAFPFVLRSILPVLRGMNPHLREAAQVLGASTLRVLRHIDLPILRRSLLVGVVFAFTISMGEFSASLLVSRPQFPTLPVAIYRLLGQPGRANFGQALAMSVILMTVTAVGYILIENLRYGREEF